MKVYFTVAIDGKEVHSVENANPETYTDVKVMPGSYPRPEASYRDLVWENLPAPRDFETKIRRNQKIGKIHSWGPFFRVSFDVNFVSLSQDSQRLSVLAFLSARETGEIVPVPGIFHAKGSLLVDNNVLGGRIENMATYDNIERNRWYNLIIEHRSDNRKVIRPEHDPHMLYHNF